MLVSKFYWSVVQHAIGWSLCLLGSNLNVHVKSEKLRMSGNTIGI